MPPIIKSAILKLPLSAPHHVLAHDSLFRSVLHFSAPERLDGLLFISRTPVSRWQQSRIDWRMASVVDAAGNPIPTSAVLTASSKHIGIRCLEENVAFLKCKKKDPNPEKCLDKGREVTRCVLGLLKDLHQKCTNEMDAYVGCMYYHTNEFDMCRKEQAAFEKSCPLE